VAAAGRGESDSLVALGRRASRLATRSACDGRYWRRWTPQRRITLERWRPNARAISLSLSPRQTPTTIRSRSSNDSRCGEDATRRRTSAALPNSTRRLGPAENGCPGSTWPGGVGASRPRACRPRTALRSAAAYRRSEHFLRASAHGRRADDLVQRECLVGIADASKKSAVRRCLSRLAIPLGIEPRLDGQQADPPQPASETAETAVMLYELRDDPPQTRSATSTTRASLRHCSSSVSGFPLTELAKPH